MTSTIDPEVQEILDEVLNDPESTLTRVPERGFGGLSETSRISEGEPWLTKAERHLLRAHRESVSALLGSACQEAILRNGARSIGLCRNITLKTALKRVDVVQWKALAQHELSIEASHACIESDAIRPLSALKSHLPASHLALLSLKVLPKDETRIWLGNALLVEDQRRTAWRCYQDVLAGRPNSLNRAITMVNLAFVSISRGQVITAFDIYKLVAKSNGDIPAVLAGLMHTSLALGDRRTLMEASQAFGVLVPAGHEVADECRLAIEGIASTLLKPTTAALDMLTDSWDLLAPVARHVLRPLRGEPEEQS